MLAIIVKSKRRHRKIIMNMNLAGNQVLSKLLSEFIKSLLKKKEVYE